MPETQKFQRRTVLVKRSLQIKYVGLVFVSVLLACLIVGLDLYHTMARMLLADNPSLTPAIIQLNWIFLFKIAVYLFLILLVSLYVSHRFAGPIYRFEKSAQIISSGDLTHRVSLRTGDELLELQEEFNGMLASLQGLVLKDRGLVLRLAERLSTTIRKLPDDERGAALREDLSSLRMELEHLTQSFKV
jgi:methyl-accepting chemotaxis protein